ncbi:hypothetical protein F0562_006868 [Nyssa sinensis]|uniref:Uncharacterized protein n=1 Tax=Nyssa sinensis TaxID=561372 RepID=A0A5J5AMV2_9ASTE|nr:hypothetical protein F0562_006868 [Nyssa sinensis]
MLILSKEELLFLVQDYYGMILAAVFCVGVTFLLSKAFKRVSTGDPGDIPGRLGFPLLGETFSFLSAANSAKGCYDFVRLRRIWHGKWFKTRIFGEIHVFTPSVECAKTIFANDFVQFNKSFVKSMADVFGEKSLLCVTQENHKRIRHILSDPFSMNALSKFVEKFDKMLSERLKKLEKQGKSFAMLDFATKIAFDAICDMLMSVTEPSLLQQIQRDVDDVSDAMLSLAVMIPGTRYYKGIQLDDTEIKDNLLTLILAGESTTAAATMWGVKFLDENKEAQDRLREEQLLILRKKPEGASLTLEDLNNMSYGSKVVKEILRMSNVLLWFPYVTLNDSTIEGFKIKKGWYVNIDATGIHYDPTLHKDPMKFNPSRFDEPQKPYSYVPFGAGHRTCLGINMAKLTILIFLHRLTSGYKWRVDDPDPSLERKAHIPRLRSGCPITLTAL